MLPPPRAIPTRVGTTSWSQSLWSRWSGHPHACGDYPAKCSSIPSQRGPSPRVWGLRQAQASASLASSGHPHACGDYSAKPWPGCGRLGPSPRVWGLRPLDERRFLAPRAIPTRVGTTQLPHGTLLFTPGHPHACGDYGARGDHEPPHHRAIPTRVGTTAGGSSTASSVAGHPHACGDYRSSASSRARAPGPSPRVWGLHARANRPGEVNRAIPTRVGTTR